MTKEELKEYINNVTDTITECKSIIINQNKRIGELEKDVKYYEQKHAGLVIEWDNAKRQFTKAKKFIKDLLGSENTCCEEEMYFEIRQKVENFLKESEVEK